MKQYILITLCAFCFFQTEANDLRKVVKAVKKAEYNRAFILLSQSLEQESINPAAKWYLAELLSTDSIDFYRLDSARSLIQDALIDFDSASQKTIELLTKQGYTRATLMSTFDKIKMISLRDAIKQNTVEALEQFTLWYPDSPGQQTVLRLRDSLSFLTATNENTWQAMERYIFEFPQSHWVVLANVKYEKLFYQDFTKDQSKKSFEQFVLDYPLSPYLDDAISHIYNYISVHDKSEIWKEFLEKYPKSKSASKATARLYHLDKEAFFRFPGLLKTAAIDSFIHVFNMESMPLLPIIVNEKIGFINQKGELVIPPFYQPNSHDSIFCQIFTIDYFGTDKGVMNRNMDIFSTEEFENIIEVGNGVLLLKKGNSGTLIFKNGELIAKDIADAVLFDQKWIKAKRNGKFGLLSTSGNTLSAFQYDEIMIRGDFWLFYIDNRIAVTNEKQIVSETGEGGFTLEFKFEEVELINDQLMIGFNDNRECLLKADLEFLIPWGVYEVNPDPYFAYVRNPDQSYRIFSHKITQLMGASIFQQLYVTGKWMAVKNEYWQLLNLENHSLFRFDSIKLINDFAALVYEIEGPSILFPNGQKIPIDSKQIAKDLSFSIGNVKSEFLEIATEKTKSVWDRYGQFVFQGYFDDVVSLTDSLFRITYKKKQGVVDRDGFYVIEPDYDFIQIKGDLLQFLKNNKIGTFDLKHQVLLNDSYDAGFERFGEYYITSKNGLKGVIDRENSRIINFLYKEINFFNDTASWVLSDSSWQIVGHRNQLILLSNIQKIELLHIVNQESFYKILTPTGYGILSNKQGMIIDPDFTDIKSWQISKDPIFLCEYYHGKTEFYLLAYYNSRGEKIYSGAQTASIYEQFYCE